MIITVSKSIEVLKKSGVVAIPTETVYGLAGVATDNIAVDKIYKAKNRPSDNPLICHFYSLDQIKKYVLKTPRYLDILVEAFSPGPISYLLKLDVDSSLKIATCGLDSVICRIPNHPLTLKILKGVDLPIAAPSANTSTKYSPTSSEMVEQDLGDKIDGIVEGGNCDIGIESTVLDCTSQGSITILRPGAIGKLAIKKVLKLQGFDIQINYKKKDQVTPGNKYRHYSPNTKIIQVQHFEDILNPQDIAIIGMQKDIERLEIVLKKSQNIHFINLGLELKDVSKNLYQRMHDLDALNVNKAYYIYNNLGNSDLALGIQNKLDKILD